LTTTGALRRLGFSGMLALRLAGAGTWDLRSVV